MRRLCTSLMVLATGMTLLAGCSDDDSASASPLAATVTENGDQIKLNMPSSVKAGTVDVTFTNSGQAPHSLQFVKVAGNHTTDDLITFIKEEEGGPIPDWISEGGGVGTVAPGQTGTAALRLSEGKHFVWDDENDDNDVHNATKGAITELDVTSGSSGKLPASTATVEAKEYQFSVTGLEAGANKIKFENTGSQFHHFIAAPLGEGKTLDDAKAFFASQGQGGGEPPIIFDKAVAVSVVGPGNSIVADLTLDAGKYAMVCFVNDKTGGPPHFTKGMIQEVTVS